MQMSINDPDFMRRRVLLGNNEYSPKKRWDQNAFGSERRLLIDHVEKTLRQHQNDGDILEKFKKEADEMKEKKRREKFPYLFNSSNTQENLIISPINNKPPGNYSNEFEQPQILQPHLQRQIKEKQSLIRPLEAPSFLPPISPYSAFAIPSPNPFQLEARIQYERTIAQKNLQLYKREEKIKRQKREINRLYRQLKEKEKQEELEKYVKSHEEIRKMNQMLADMKDELTSRKPLLNNRSDVLVDAHQQADRKRNKSQTQLNNYSNIFFVKEHVRDRTYDKDVVPRQPPSKHNQSLTTRKSLISGFKQASSLGLASNPQIEYSGQIKKNRSSVFQKVPLYNSPLIKVGSLNGHLDELKNYNKRLEYLQDYNQSKLSQIP